MASGSASGTATPSAAAAAAAGGSAPVIVGIDFGSNVTVVSYIKPEEPNTPVLVHNAVSEIDTRSLVAFNGPRYGAARRKPGASEKFVPCYCMRFVGEFAKEQLRSNADNTIADLVRLTGASAADYAGAHNPHRRVHLLEQGGRLGVRVKYGTADEDLWLSTEHAAGTLLHHLVQMVRKEVPEAADLSVTVAVPPSYTSRQRQALIDGAAIMNLKSVEVIDSVSALAAAFHAKHKGRLAEEPVPVMFVDIGQTYATVAIAKISNKGGHVASVQSRGTMGGYRVDELLYEKAVSAAKARFPGAEIAPGSKRALRILTECEATKRRLSSNKDTFMELENVANDQDLKFAITRAELEALMGPLADEFRAMLQAVLAEAGVAPETVTDIELVGGGTRIPLLQSVITQTVNDRLRFTLDSTAAISQGTALLVSARAQARASLLQAVFAKLAAGQSASPAAEAAEGKSDVDMATGFAEDTLAQQVIVGKFAEDDGAAATGMSADEIVGAQHMEQRIHEREQALLALDAARNDLESFIYKMRSEITGQHGSHLADAELGPLLNAAEEFLYTDDAQVTEKCVQRTEELKCQVQARCPEYFEAIAKQKAAEEAEAEALRKQYEAERAAEGDDPDDHDNRRLRKPDRMRRMLKQKEEGNELFTHNNFKQAAIHYIKSLQHSSKFFDLTPEDKKEVDAVVLSLHLNLAQCYLKLENWHKAAESCKSALEIDANNVKAMFRRATALEELAKLDEAEELITKALALEPSNKAVVAFDARIKKIRAAEAAKRKRMAQAMFS